MDLQTIQIIFYSLGSIFFAILILGLIGIIIGIYLVKRKVDKVTNIVNNTIYQAKDLYDHKEKYILRLVKEGSSTFIESIVNIFVKK